MTDRLKYYAITVVLFLMLSFSLERRAYAYVDPGSSLLVFQSLSAIFTGTVFYFRRRLKSLFTRAEAAEAQVQQDQP